MKNKVDTLRRIHRLQGQLHELGKWRLAALNREHDELTVAHEQVIDALGRGVTAYGPLAGAATKRLRTIAQQMDAAAATRDAQGRHVLDLGARAKLAGTALETAGALYRAAVERKDLMDLTEGWMAANKASPEQG